MKKVIERDKSHPRLTKETSRIVASPLPLVAILGRPNVGKSTLFNRLCGGHNAIVNDEPGVTRDRRYGKTEYDGVSFRVVDTGGLDFSFDDPAVVQNQIVRQSLLAVEEASLLIWVGDAKQGLLSEDKQVVQTLRRMQKPIVYVANKVDGPKDEMFVSELYGLGADIVYGISASHGRGVADLLEAIVKHLRQHVVDHDSEEYEEPDTSHAEQAGDLHVVKVALLGRPNAGKSSLINQLLGEDRMIVHDQPGTTRDPVDTLMTYQGNPYLLIDTAGIRRRARVYEPMEKVAVAMAEKAVHRADVVLLVIDAHAGIGEQDAKIAGMVQEAGKALILVYNKEDLLKEADKKRVQEQRERILHFVPWARELFCSAESKRGTIKLLTEARNVYASYTKRVSTGALNRFFEGIVERHPPPLYRGMPIKLYYITQAQVCPPTFVISVNHPEGMHFSYERYLQNQIRDTFSFVGTPIRILARKRGGV